MKDGLRITVALRSKHGIFVVLTITPTTEKV
jgi:hypothetical protein